MDKKNKTKKRAGKRNKTSVFKSTIDNFTYNIDCLIFSLPLVINPLLKEYKASDKTLSNFLSKNAKKKGDNYLVKLEDSQQFAILNEKNRNSYLAIRMVPRSLFISLVSFFDNYLREFLKIAFDKNPGLLNNTEKKISVSEILDIKSFNEARNYLIDREIQELLYGGRFKCLEWLEKRLDIKFDFDPVLKKKFIEISERRNLFVHSDGVVTKKYLSVCKENEILIEKDLKVGDQLSLSLNYFVQASYIILSIGVELGQVLWRKLEPKELEKADSSLLNMTAKLLSNGNNLVAARLLDFANKLKKFSSEEIKRMLIINRALAMKFGNAQDKADKIIGSHDWSATDKKFKLAVAIIKDNLKEATYIMLEIGPTNEMKAAYKEDWPLFKEFRKSPAFRKTYKKIFKESFIIRSKKQEN